MIEGLQVEHILPLALRREIQFQCLAVSRGTGRTGRTVLRLKSSETAPVPRVMRQLVFFALQVKKST